MFAHLWDLRWCSLVTRSWVALFQGAVRASRAPLAESSELPWVGLELPWVGHWANKDGTLSSPRWKMNPAWVGLELPWVGLELLWVGLELPWVGLELPWVGLELLWVGLELPWVGLELACKRLFGKFWGSLRINDIWHCGLSYYTLWNITNRIHWGNW